MSESDLQNMSETGPTPLPRPGPPARLDRTLQRLGREAPLPVVVRGSCMAPLATDGSQVAVTPRRRYRPGDVVVYRAAGGELRMHRVILALPGGRLVTRADAAPSADASVPRSRVLGRVVGGEVAPALVEPLRRHRWVARLRGLAWPFQALAARLRASSPA